MRYLTTTRNLFDISRLQAYTPETLPTNTAGVYNGTIIARAGVNSSVCESGKMLKELCPNLVAGETYTLSFETRAKSYVIYLRGANEYWHKNNSSVITEAMLNSLVGFYANYPELTVATISNFQIELGDTATDYVPYGYLPMYKGRYKISDVCQLLDKSKYPATKTTNGITFTNNGDGSFTLNGTATPARATIIIFDACPVINNHIYLLTMGSTGSYTKNYFINSYFVSGEWWVKDNICFGGVDGIIYNGIDNAYARTYLAVEPNTTVNNIVLKPQIFDLTEMYGAGNEPTTVAEFREKFPNELYPYSPYCWAKMKQLRYITTTKNLFDINQAINDTFAGNAFDTFSINDNVITATSDNSTTKIVIMRLFYGELPAGNYILSLNAVIENTPKHNRPNEIFIWKNGSFVTLNNGMPTDGSYSPKIKFTLSEKAEIKISFYKNVISSQETVSNTVYKVTLSNIQLELSDTATPYVPYGYLSLK